MSKQSTNANAVFLNHLRNVWLTAILWAVSLSNVVFIELSPISKRSDILTSKTTTDTIHAVLWHYLVYCLLNKALRDFPGTVRAITTHKDCKTSQNTMHRTEQDDVVCWDLTFNYNMG